MSDLCSDVGVPFSKPSSGLLGKFTLVFILKLEIQNWSMGYAHLCVCVLVAQMCLTLCDPIDCSLPTSSVHGVLQARVLEWVAIPFSRESSSLRDRTQISCTAGRFFTI